MFERFSAGARDVVHGAVEEARRLDAAYVTEEHLLLALLARGVLDPLGVDRTAVTEGLALARRRGGLSRADEEALAGLGIDVGEIVARVEETHGVGALAAGPARRTLGSSLRSALGRPPAARTGGHVPFGTGAKHVLERSLRIALGRKDNVIGAPHLLLALLAHPGAPADVLTDQGITYAHAETTLT
ncbi:Clp protease N-terminal domain-containing protein [Streptomyces sp. NPDC090022]|uniref:Clp protease N-terminal domain-containing protein n=1 Tax=Streptomyces sp. NPDC090022 TaxID=3365920 RepID=UPI0038117527